MTGIGRDGHVQTESALPSLEDNVHDRGGKAIEARTSTAHDPCGGGPTWDGADGRKIDIGSPPGPLPIPPLDPPPKGESLMITGDGEALETEQARIERLGRERPAKFKSAGAELAFCYSIIASQFMAVRFPLFAIGDR